MQIVCGQARAGDQPGGDGVRVPHLAGPQLVTSPHGPGHALDEVEEAANHANVAREAAGPAHRVAEIRNRSATPAANLVAEQTPAAQAATANCARADHASAGLVGVRRGRDLDRVAIAVELDDKRRVVEVTALPTLKRGFDGLEGQAVEANRMSPCTERNPIQIHGCDGRGVHSLKSRWQAADRHPESHAR
jgi:hypothetical protein